MSPQCSNYRSPIGSSLQFTGFIHSCQNWLASGDFGDDDHDIDSDSDGCDNSDDDGNHSNPDDDMVCGR